MMARKCDLKVWMARSAALRRCMSGGTSWYFAFHVSSMVVLNSALASLSRIWRSTVWPLLARRRMMELYAPRRCLSVRLAKGEQRIALVCLW